MIDDGPFARLWIHRAVKRFDLDLAAWPWPPDRGGDWSTYWEFRVVEILSMVGVLTRKLIEADKVSVELLARTFDVVEAPIRGDALPDKISFPQVERFYDLDRVRRVPLSLEQICHQLVHSFVLVPVFSLDSLHGLRFERFYLASDRARKKSVYVLDWARFVDEVVGAVCADDIVSSQMLRLPAKGALSLGSRRSGVPLYELVLLYCEGSRDRRQRYEAFVAAWALEYTSGGRPWPTLDEARAEDERRRHVYDMTSEIERS